MSSIQSFLTLGSIVILSLISLRFNSSVLENSTAEMENKVVLTAFSLADDLIEEIKTKHFDQATRNFPTTNTSTLTPSASLGKEDALYDDVDDYNNYSKLISAPHAEDYTVSCKVFYVSSSDWTTKGSNATFYKKAEVTVSSPFLRNSIKLSFIFTNK